MVTLTRRMVIAALCGMCSAVADATWPEGNPVRGEQVYQRCLACHALAYDRTGPRHCGLLGRRAGSVPGFAYSSAMREANVVWTRANLDAFLAAPTRYIPGTAMGYAGVVDAAERKDLIAFLAAASQDPARCPTGSKEARP